MTAQRPQVGDFVVHGDRGVYLVVDDGEKAQFFCKSAEQAIRLAGIVAEESRVDVWFGETPFVRYQRAESYRRAPL